MLKKLVLILSSISLVACGPGSSGANSSTDQALQSRSNQVGGPNDDIDLWTNITSTDGADLPSNMNIVAQNNSNYNLTFVGCDNGPYATIHLTDIPSGYRFPKTTNYDAQWAFLDADGNGLFAASQINSNSIAFNNTPQSASQFNCYYKVFIPEANDYMYIKLVDHSYVASSYDHWPADDSLNKPQTDEKSAQTDAMWQNIIQYGVSAFSGIVTGATGSWLAFSSREPSIDLQTYLQNYMNTQSNNFANEFTQRAFTIKDKFNKGNTAEADEELNELMELVNSKGGKYFQITNAEEFKEMLTEPGRSLSPALKFNEVTGEYTLSIPGTGAEARQYTRLVLNGDSFLDYPYIEGKGLPININDIARSMGIDPVKDPDALQKLLARGKYARQAPYNTSEFAEEGELGEIEDFANLADLPLKSITPYVAGSILAGTGVAVAEYFLFQTVMDSLLTDPGIGDFSTGVNHLRFDQITQADASSWNANHPNNQIAANTNFTSYGTDPVTGRNSIQQNGKFNFSDSSIDSQIVLDIQLSNLTNPWTRYHQYNASIVNTDPYVGCVDKTGNSCLNGVTHKGDSVIYMAISDNTVDTGKQLKDIYTQSQFAYAGLGELAVSSLSPAPIVSLQQTTNKKTGTVMFLPKLKPQPKMLASNRVPAATSTTNALILNGSEVSNLSVTVPAGSTAGVKSAQAQLGGGLNVTYVEEDESGTNQFVVARSVSASNLLTNNPDQKATASVIYAKYNCSYPDVLNQACPLTVSLLTDGDGQKHEGSLYISDQNSLITRVPVYVNYHLISEPESSPQLTQGDPGAVVHLNLTNASAIKYSQFQFSGLPNGVVLANNTCANGLSSGQSCTVDVNASNATVTGNFNVIISGIPVAGSGSTQGADQSSLGLNIVPGF